MPGRKIPIITGETYHVFNRGIDKRVTFSSEKEYQRGIDCLSYYCFASPPLKFSKYQLLAEDKKIDFLSEFQYEQNKLVDIHTFCLMPNHFHFLLTQRKENGIAKFMANFQNSYTRYFDIKHERVGSLFLDQFKAVKIDTDEQFIHVSRYIHINPTTSYIVKNYSELYNYAWSSFLAYVNPQLRTIITTEKVLSFFSSIAAYEAFLADQVDYQRTLSEINHLCVE